MVIQSSSLPAATPIIDPADIGSDEIDATSIDTRSQNSEQAITLSSSTSSPSICSSPKFTASINSSPIYSSISNNSFPILHVIDFFISFWIGFYGLLQDVIIFLFARPLPSTTSYAPLVNPLGRVAIIGAGLTGISTAAHFLTHGFEVVIFEQSDSIGGIWARVNSTSSLQLDSFMYRFHPLVKWSNHFPVRKSEILEQIHKVWNHYRLTSRTRLNVTVNSLNPVQTSRQSTQWTVNDGTDGIFDAVVVASGTCGQPQRISFEGRERFTGKMIHSSELDHVNWKNKRVIVIGGGASAVEALELAVQSDCASPAILVTRTDKWFIPRSMIIGTLIASNSLGYPSFIDKITEKFVRTFHYGSDLEWISPTSYDGKPAEALYSKTPIVNGEFLKLVRAKRADYVRAKINRISAYGMEIHRFGSQKSQMIEADVIVEATGYHRPSLNFLSAGKLFSGPKGPNQYSPPNLFLQNFVPNDWSCLMTNAGYFEGIGTVGFMHIGILARILMMFLLDKKTAPNSTEMRAWVDRKIESKGTLKFFTYSELSLWLLVFLVSNPRRWSWLVFIITGWGKLGTIKQKVI